MTRKESPDDLMPQRNNILPKQIALGSVSALALVGLTGYASVRLGFEWMFPNVPHLLALSVLAFGVGTGMFSILLNYFTTDVVSRTRMLKMVAVYAPIIGLLVPLVDVGAFHPKLAMVFLCFLSAIGVVHAVFLGKNSLTSDCSNRTM